ncbi:putative N-acetyltransferase HLS1 [Silene latifolia]|uniref:putative N-acetyltransferase HLS1 n=1 Tax=Silene latifolia TaxID=37657 RepID=UPI003D77673A
MSRMLVVVHEESLINEKIKKNDENKILLVREYDEEKDKEKVEEMEIQSELGQQDGKSSTLVTHLLGDPLGRIRHFPSRIMMVAEYEGEMVGVIRCGIKTVTRGKKIDDPPIYVKLAYILGLRVSPMHRQKGVATKLVKRTEEWCKENGAQYVYMMTDCSNEPSINLFTRKFDYTKVCTPTVLGQPVHAHRKPITSGTTIIRVSPQLAESMYRHIFRNSEFFPKDIGMVLSSKLNLGTFIAVPRGYLPKWDPKKELPPCFAIMSVWNTKEVYQLELKGAAKLTKAFCLGSRVLDAHMPWLRVPSIPNVFSPFGFYFLYGLHMEGKGSLSLMKGLCNFAHNMARKDVACGAVVAEVAPWDPVCEVIPHWKKFSWNEDLWCMKKLAKDGSDEESEPLDWVSSRSTLPTLFVDPRDF